MYKKLKISAPPPKKNPSIAEIAQYVLHKYEDPSLHPQDPHKARCSVRHSDLSTGDGKAEEHSRSLSPLVRQSSSISGLQGQQRPRLKQ